MTTQTIAPTTEAEVNSSTSFGFSCYITLADTERIIVELSEQVWDSSRGRYVLSADKKKFQLERLHYRTGRDFDNDEQVAEFDGGIIRGFRKDGALKFRESYIPRHQYKDVLAQIPDHYHEYARVAFDVEMEQLRQRVATTIKNGLKIND